MSKTIKDGNFIGGEDLRSFLMIGQSNMAGRGEFADVEPIKNFRCYMLRNGRFLRMSEPVNPDRAIFEGLFHSGTSLAASFADTLASEYKCRVGLIPCADGGTYIDEWQPGEILYEHAVFMTKLAMKNSTLSGILWHQGESDCETDELLTSYTEKLKNLVASLRRDLGCPDIPFIAGELSTLINRDFVPRVPTFNSQLHAAVREIPNFAVVSSDGLELKPDGIHFNAVSLRVFGKRYFNAYKEFIKA